MEALRRQIHDESTMIAMLDKQLSNDNRELDALNEAETARAEQVCDQYVETIFFLFIFRRNVLRLIYKQNAIL
jgi:hypothetical protein